MSSAPEFTVFLVGRDGLAERALQRHLARQYAVHSAKSAADVEKLMRTHPPDVVVCEIGRASCRERV